jgi:hypothetical protein
VLRQTVNKTASSVVVTSSANPSTFGQSGGFTATVTPITATGTVQFQDGSTVLGSVAISSGTAAISFSALSPGAHSLTAVCSGDANYLSSTSAPVTQTVNKNASSVAVTSSLNPSIYNQTIALTAQVTPTSANGTVQFLDGSTLLGAAPVSEGLAVLTLGSLSVGAHSITAVYSGDANDAPSTSAILSQTVNKAGFLVESIDLRTIRHPLRRGYAQHGYRHRSVPGWICRAGHGHHQQWLSGSVALELVRGRTFDHGRLQRRCQRQLEHI